MSKLFIRVLSFVSKELNEIRRQPRLILSLILGPFLILLLFGAGYRSNRPILRAVLVVPADVQAEIPMDDVRRILEANLELVDVRTDPGTAMEELEEGSIDVVGIFPSNIEERVLEGDQSLVEFKYNEINPINEQWIQYLAYAQVNEINRALLLQATSRAQDEAVPIRDLLAEAQTNLSRMQEGLSEVEQANLERYLPQLREAIDILGTAPILVAQADAGRSDAMEIRRELVRLRDELLILEQALEEGTIAEQQQRIAFVQDQLVEVQDAANILTSLPPEVIVSPLRQEVENLRGSSLDYMTYYAPGVLMLIVQHMAVTLGALSLVRERARGVYQLYRVAPVSMLHVLIGKYIAYTGFIAVIAATLTVLMYWGLGIPFLGTVANFAGVVLLFALASLGVGFFISVVSGTDSQAVQLSMLVLLLSVFFSGFLMPLENFWAPVQVVGYMLPLTHGIDGLQHVLLQGTNPDLFTWACLTAIAIISFAALASIARAQFRRGYVS